MDLNKRRLYFFVLGLMIGLIPLQVLAQAEEVMPQIRELRQGRSIPPSLLSGRTLVLISPGQSQWQDLAAKVHPIFVMNKVDAVAYYQLEEVFAGPDAQKEMLPQLQRRQFANVAIILEDNRGNLELILSAFSGDESFVKPQAIAWATKGGIEELNSSLKSALAQESLSQSNFLIPDFPEFFRAASIPQAKRFETFNPDIKLDNLAVRTFPSDNARNAEISRIFAQYPFKFETVNPAVTEDQLRRNGFQWILGYFRAPEGNLREILGYKGDYKPGGALVYKFYVRQLYSGEIYLGNSWDAHPDFNKALEAYINNLRNTIR